MRGLLLALALVAPGISQAQEVSGCVLDTGAVAWEFLALETTLAAQPVHAAIEIQCEAGLDYRIEVANALPGGRVSMLGDGASIEVRLVQGSQGQMPWGRDVDGEAIEGTGTGEVQAVPIQAHLVSHRAPSAGIYQVSLDIRVDF